MGPSPGIPLNNPKIFLLFILLIYFLFAIKLFSNESIADKITFTSQVDEVF